MAAGPDDVSFQGKTGSSRPDDQNDANGPTPDIAPCRCHAALMHGAEAKASAPLCSDALPLYHHAKMTGIQRSLRQGEVFMRRNIIASLALLLWAAGLTASAVAQQPVKLGVLNDQTGLYADLTGLGSANAARRAAADHVGPPHGRARP